MITIKNDNFNIKQIADSGQAFRFEEYPDGHFGLAARERYLRIFQNGNEISLDCSKEDFEKVWKVYFDLDTDYDKIGERILTSKDKYLIETYNFGRGIRILRQDLWEICISFLISQNNNIKRIRKSVKMLCESCGKLMITEDGEQYSFPSAIDIPDEIWEKREMGFGYRGEYLKDFSNYVRANPEWADKLSSLSYEEAMTELLSHKGIGKKVANCICLFGLHHVGAFPVDTHIKQILETHYPAGFDFERYDGVAGIVQQFMFYNKLNT